MGWWWSRIPCLSRCMKVWLTGWRVPIGPRGSLWSWSSVSWLWGWKLRSRGVSKRLICRLGCRLRSCLSNILLGPTCRINSLCIYHSSTSYKHITTIMTAYKHMKQGTKWLGWTLNILTTLSFWSLYLLCHVVSPVMITLQPLKLCHSLWHFPHLIVLFILNTLYGFLGSSGVFFFSLGGLRGGL